MTPVEWMDLVILLAIAGVMVFCLCYSMINEGRIKAATIYAPCDAMGGEVRYVIYNPVRCITPTLTCDWYDEWVCVNRTVAP